MKRILFLLMLFTAACQAQPKSDYYWETDTLAPTLTEKDYPKKGEFKNSVRIVFQDGKITCSKSKAISSKIKDGTITISSKAENVRFILSGKSSAGSIVLDSDSRCMVELNGLELQSTDCPAIEIVSKKRTFIEVSGSSTLSSDSTVIKSKGELVFVNSNGLTLNSQQGHAVSSSGHIAILDGTYTLNSAKDGFHTRKKFIMNNGTVVITAQSNGVECAKGSISIDGGNLKINSQGHALSTSYNESSADVRAAVIVNGGQTVIQTSGDKAKGIKAWNYFRMNGGSLDISTSGYKAKGIRAEGSVFITGGNITVNTYSQEAEGIESKRDFYMTDGNVLVFAYDDAINAGRHLVIDGGMLYASAIDNDGIDSNGDIEINGGIIAGLGGHAPEEGIDCDFGTFAINGGIVLGMGSTRMTSPTGSACKQLYSFIQGPSMDRGILDIRDGKGNQLLDIMIHRNYSNAVILFSHPDLEVGAEYTLSKAGSMNGGNLLQEYYYKGGSYSDGELMAEFTQQEMPTNGRGGFGGPMGGGFGGPMGGGFPGGDMGGGFPGGNMGGGFPGGDMGGGFPGGGFGGPMGGAPQDSTFMGRGGFGRQGGRGEFGRQGDRGGQMGGFPGGGMGGGPMGGGFGGMSRQDDSFIRHF